MNDIVNKVEELTKKCRSGQCSSSHVVTVDDISKALRKLKPHKHDGSTDLTSDHLLNCSDAMKVRLSILFTTMLKHGYLPDPMRASTIISIPKDRRKSLASSAN